VSIRNRQWMSLKSHTLPEVLEEIESAMSPRPKAYAGIGMGMPTRRPVRAKPGEHTSQKEKNITRKED
jgi:hypothetical protein